MSTTDGKKKRGPGRPKINIIKSRDQYSGIVDKPQDESNMIELSYIEPQIFTHYFQIIRSYSTNYICNNLDIYFRKDKVYLICSPAYEDKKTNTNNQIINSNGNFYITMIIDCNKIDRYYCAEPYAVRIQCNEYLYNIMTNLTPSHTELSWHINSFFNEYMIVAPYSKSLGGYQNWPVNIIPINENEMFDFDKIEKIDYQIAINYNSTDFKHYLGLIKSQEKTTELNISARAEDKYFVFKIDYFNKSHELPVKDAKDKNLHFNVKSPIFKSSININKCTKFLTHIKNTVRFYCDVDKYMLEYTGIDVTLRGYFERQ